jgi:DNA invertase Pin-like site-specific DNA recombinase
MLPVCTIGTLAPDLGSRVIETFGGGGDFVAGGRHRWTRLARGTTDSLRIVDDLDRRGAGLIMLSMGGQTIDTRSPTGRLMVTMPAAIAEFERGLLLERQREGVAKAKQEGKYKGRQPTARAKAVEVIKFDAEGLQRAEIARRTGIGVASVYRVLADAKKLDAGRTIPV